MKDEVLKLVLNNAHKRKCRNLAIALSEARTTAMKRKIWGMFKDL